jgi:putative glutamine amidotransferase
MAPVTGSLRDAPVIARRPLIGVTTSEVRLPPNTRPIAEADPPQREMALGMPYLRAVERAGGIPVVLPPLAAEAVPSLLEHLSGVCLSGGPDLDPAAYGAKAHPELGDTEPDLDAFEYAVAGEADRRGMPLFGICRGLQTMNVARGGTLHQHLADVTDGSVVHRQHAAGRIATHRVEISPASRIALTMGVNEADVNSFHHQAADRLGSGLRAVAWAPDGVVEAIEAVRGPMYIAVQWHAESLVDRREHHRLFEALVEEASRWSGALERPAAA